MPRLTLKIIPGIYLHKVKASLQLVGLTTEEKNELKQLREKLSTLEKGADVKEKITQSEGSPDLQTDPDTVRITALENKARKFFRQSRINIDAALSKSFQEAVKAIQVKVPRDSNNPMTGGFNYLCEDLIKKEGQINEDRDVKSLFEVRANTFTDRFLNGICTLQGYKERPIKKNIDDLEKIYNVHCENLRAFSNMTLSSNADLEIELAYVDQNNQAININEPTKQQTASSSFTFFKPAAPQTPWTEGQWTAFIAATVFTGGLAAVVYAIYWAITALIHQCMGVNEKPLSHSPVF